MGRRSRLSAEGEEVKIEGLAPPQDLSAEGCCLSGMMMSESARHEVFPVLRETDFYAPKHRILFAAMMNLENIGSQVDPVTVSQELQRMGKAKAAGGAVYLAKIVEALPLASHAPDYARIVIGLSKRRAVAQAAAEIANEAFNGKLPDIGPWAQERIFAAAQRRGLGASSSFKDCLLEAIKDMEGGTGAGRNMIKTDMFGLHRHIPGFGPGDMIVIAARPSVGKSALARRIAFDLAKNAGQVLIFSLEESKRQITLKAISASSGIYYRTLISGMEDGHSWDQVMKATNEMCDLPIEIDDRCDINMYDIAAECRRMHSRKPVKAVIIDYLQLMSTPDGVAKSREREVAWSSSRCKVLAKDLGAPVFALCQLNRNTEFRTDSRPRLADLRESGAIEQDADIVILLYRQDLSDIHRQRNAMPFRVGVMELIIGKNRSGPLGRSLVRLIPDTMGVQDLSDIERSNYWETFENGGN